MGNSSSLTDAEATAVKHINSKDVASLMKLLEQEPVDLFKLVSLNEDNPEDIKNGYDFIHTLLSAVGASSSSSSSSSSSVISILKAFKQTIEANKQKNTAANSSSDEKPFRESPQFDKFPYSYLQFVIFNNPQDLESFIFLLDNKETFPSPPPASQSLVHDLCSNPRAIELLRHLISSGEFPERFENTSSTNNLDEQMRGTVNSVVIEKHRSFTPLQAACAAVNKLAVQELCVAGLGGSNYGECAETLFASAIAGEQDDNLGSMVLFKKENLSRAVSADDVSDILLCLLAQPNAGSSIRKHRLQLSSIRSEKARDNIVAVFKSQFNVSSLDTLNLMDLAFVFYDGLGKNTNKKSESSANNDDDINNSAQTFLRTVVDNKLAVCTTVEHSLGIENLFITGPNSLEGVDFTKCIKITDTGLQHLAKLSSLQSLNLEGCDKITDSGLQHLAKLSSLKTLNLNNCKLITNSGVQYLAKLPSLQSLTLWCCGKITDNGLQHLEYVPSLQSLNLYNCYNITDTGLQHLAKLSTLQSLNLTLCNKVTDSGLQYLAKLSSLQSLNLSSCNRITDSGLQHLAKLSSLQSLNLRDCKWITDSGLQHLAKLSSLQILTLDKCEKITNSGLQHLANLSSLLSLNLQECDKITDDGLPHLAQLSSLQSLNLSYCDKITDSGLQHVANVTSLQTLNLDCCGKITDNGLEHLAKLSSLRSLNLASCRLITDSGLHHLAKLSSLQSLDLTLCNKITDSGLQRFKEQNRCQRTSEQ